MIKISKATVTKQQIKGKYGPFDAYIIKGDGKDDTYPIRDELKRLGFRYYNGTWWISANKYSQSIQSKLSQLGVDLSSITGQPSQPSSTSQSAKPETQPTQPKEPSRKQWATEDEEMSRWYGFPINKNIYTGTIELKVDDNLFIEPIAIHRSYVPGKTGGYYRRTKSREYKGYPLYQIEIGKLDEPVKTIMDEQPREHITGFNYKSKEKWGEYNEEETLKTLLDMAKQTIEESTKSKARNALLWHYDLLKRTDELKVLLEETYVKGFFIDIDSEQSPEYNGRYPIQSNNISGAKETSTYIQTDLEHQFSPGNVTLTSVVLYGVHTPEDYYNKINEYILENQKELGEKYIEYLKSFPFLQDEQEQGKQDYDKINSYIVSKSPDVETLIRELNSYGYIRPHKRQKQSVGIGRGEEIKWVIDSKKIVDDTYSWSKSKYPEFFYTVLAYYIHRKIRGIWSWSDMMLMDVLRSWYRTMVRFGSTFKFDEIEAALSSIGNAIINRIYGRTTKEQANDDFKKWMDGEDFGAGGTGGNIMDQVGTQVTLAELREFLSFAKQYNIDLSDVENIGEHVKDIYRALAKKVHPDLHMSPEQKEKAEEEFKNLQGIWSRVPSKYKLAFYMGNFIKMSDFYLNRIRRV